MHASAKTISRRQIERQIIEDGTAVWRTKKEIESLIEKEEKKKQWIMLATYNPWGKPGHGAPMPGALRKTKWIFDSPNSEKDVHSAIALGRPGHGAPLRTPSGKTRTYIKADPLIRFQLHDSARRAVENDLRYRATPTDKENYRKELDAIVCQKKQKKTEIPDDTPCEKQKMRTLRRFKKINKTVNYEVQADCFFYTKRQPWSSGSYMTELLETTPDMSYKIRNEIALLKTRKQMLHNIYYHASDGHNVKKEETKKEKQKVNQSSVAKVKNNYRHLKSIFGILFKFDSLPFDL